MYNDQILCWQKEVKGVSQCKLFKCCAICGYNIHYKRCGHVVYLKCLHGEINNEVTFYTENECEQMSVNSNSCSNKTMNWANIVAMAFQYQEYCHAIKIILASLSTCLTGCILVIIWIIDFCTVVRCSLQALNTKDTLENVSLFIKKQSRHSKEHFGQGGWNMLRQSHHEWMILTLQQLCIELSLY